MGKLWRVEVWIFYAALNLSFIIKSSHKNPEENQSHMWRNKPFFPSQIAVNRCFPKLSKARKHPQLFPPKIKTAYLNKRRNTININAWCGCPSPAAHRSRVSPACERGVCCLLQPCTLVHAHTCLLVVVNSWPHLSLLMAAQPSKPWIFFGNAFAFLFLFSNLSSGNSKVSNRWTLLSARAQTNAFGHTVPALKNKNNCQQIFDAQTL